MSKKRSAPKSKAPSKKDWSLVTENYQANFDEKYNGWPLFRKRCCSLGGPGCAAAAKENKYLNVTYLTPVYVCKEYLKGTEEALRSSVTHVCHTCWEANAPKKRARTTNKRYQ